MALCMVCKAGCLLFPWCNEHLVQGLMDSLDCLVTKNPCGTDTWAKEYECHCTECQDWLYLKNLNEENK
jgi:hypothetical protein